MIMMTKGLAAHQTESGETDQRKSNAHPSSSQPVSGEGAQHHRNRDREVRSLRPVEMVDAVGIEPTTPAV